MIGSIRGVLINNEPGDFLIEVGGLGYQVQVPTKVSYDVTQQGTEIYLLTHFIVREDGQQLYGFLEEAERELFRKIIKISGVGPRLALAIISGLDVEGFICCVVESDISNLVTIPGVGKKTAERLIVEMRDKLPEKFEGKPTIEIKNASIVAFSDAEKALVSLGYRASDARKMVATAAEGDQSLGSEDLIRKALRTISRT